MPNLTNAIVPLLSPFASLFDARTWRKARWLLIGAVPAPGQRTLCACLRAHRAAGRTQLRPLSPGAQPGARVRPGGQPAAVEAAAAHLDPGGPLVFGLDETIERRSGPRIEAKGMYRSQIPFVNAMGLRWISLMWLVRIPWAGRVWTLPFLTVLAPSARYHAQQGRCHKTLTRWARRMLACLRRWLPDRRPMAGEA